MKTLGLIFVILGGLSFLGCLYGGNSSIGPLFFIGLGAYLIHRANEKIKEKKEKEEWEDSKQE